MQYGGSQHCKCETRHFWDVLMSETDTGTNNSVSTHTHSMIDAPQTCSTSTTKILRKSGFRLTNSTLLQQPKLTSRKSLSADLAPAGRRGRLCNSSPHSRRLFIGSLLPRGINLADEQMTRRFFPPAISGREWRGCLEREDQGC